MESKPVPSRQLPAVVQGFLALLWGLICFFMLLSAILGLGCVVLGILSLFVDLTGVFELQLGGESVRTTTQKVLFMAVGAGMALSGIGFWWLRGRGYIGRALLLYVALIGLFVVIGWLSGSTNIISVGG